MELVLVKGLVLIQGVFIGNLSPLNLALSFILILCGFIGTFIALPTYKSILILKNEHLIRNSDEAILLLELEKKKVEFLTKQVGALNKKLEDLSHSFASLKLQMTAVLKTAAEAPDWSEIIDVLKDVKDKLK